MTSKLKDKLRIRACFITGVRVVSEHLSLADRRRRWKLAPQKILKGAFLLGRFWNYSLWKSEPESTSEIANAKLVTKVRQKSRNKSAYHYER